MTSKGKEQYCSFQLKWKGAIPLLIRSNPAALKGANSFPQYILSMYFGILLVLGGVLW